MNDVERAAQFLLKGATFALVKDNEIFSTDRNGIAPLLELAEQGKNLTGFSAADKIVGKAAALLYCYMGVEQVYAEVMSRAAGSVFDKNGVKYSYGTLTNYIVNRKGDGMCPMESAVLNTDAPAEAVCALRKTLDNLKKNSN